MKEVKKKSERHFKEYNINRSRQRALQRRLRPTKTELFKRAAHAGSGAVIGYRAFQGIAKIGQQLETRGFRKSAGVLKAIGGTAASGVAAVMGGGLSNLDEMMHMLGGDISDNTLNIWRRYMRKQNLDYEQDEASNKYMHEKNKNLTKTMLGREDPFSLPDEAPSTLEWLWYATALGLVVGPYLYEKTREFEKNPPPDVSSLPGWVDNPRDSAGMSLIDDNSAREAIRYLDRRHNERHHERTKKITFHGDTETDPIVIDDDDEPDAAEPEL